MNEIIINSTEELAGFLNKKAGEGFTENMIATGAFIVPLATDWYQCLKEFPVTMEYGTHGTTQLVIGDIM